MNPLACLQGDTSYASLIDMQILNCWAALERASSCFQKAVYFSLQQCYFKKLCRSICWKGYPFSTAWLV